MGQSEDQFVTIGRAGIIEQSLEPPWSKSFGRSPMMTDNMQNIFGGEKKTSFLGEVVWNQ